MTDKKYWYHVITQILKDLDHITWGQIEIKERNGLVRVWSMDPLMHGESCLAQKVLPLNSDWSTALLWGPHPGMRKWFVILPRSPWDSNFLEMGLFLFYGAFSWGVACYKYCAPHPVLTIHMWPSSPATRRDMIRWAWLLIDPLTSFEAWSIEQLLLAVRHFKFFWNSITISMWGSFMITLCSVLWYSFVI